MNDELHDITIVTLAGLRKCLTQVDKYAKQEAERMAERKALAIAKKENAA